MMDQRNLFTPDSQRRTRRSKRRIPDDVHNPSPAPDLDFPDPDPKTPTPKRNRGNLLVPYSADLMAFKRQITTPESQHRLRRLTKAEKAEKKETRRLAKHFKEVDEFELEVV
ncbi:MAG: hypothetical protein CMK59_02825 [Proteobacteria bacterium]|nr:hypothetical protein [Pseudomonadota bacterium]